MLANHPAQTALALAGGRGMFPLTVSIPSGIDNGQRLVLKGDGDVGP